MENTGFSHATESGDRTIHNPGGQADPAATTGPAADAADIAATDMNPLPSSRTQDTQPVFGEGMTPRAEAEAQEWKDRYLRLAAEFDNYKKRVARERLETVERTQAQVVGKLLDALDDLERALASDPATTPADALRGAAQAIDTKLRKELTALGVERLDPTGTTFDPALHEAIGMTPAPETAQANLVAATYQAGYRLRAALIRPARVQVFS